MPMSRHVSRGHRTELRLPDLGLDDAPVTASMWLVEAGHEVTAGDRVLEVLSGSVTVDLPAPVSGRLIEMTVEVDEPLAVGQLLGVIAVHDMREAEN